MNKITKKCEDTHHEQVHTLKTLNLKKKIKEKVQKHTNGNPLKFSMSTFTRWSKKALKRHSLEDQNTYLLYMAFFTSNVGFFLLQNLNFFGHREMKMKRIKAKVATEMEEFPP